VSHKVPEPPVRLAVPAGMDEARRTGQHGRAKMLRPGDVAVNGPGSIVWSIPTGNFVAGALPCFTGRAPCSPVGAALGWSTRVRRRFPQRAQCAERRRSR
jgi:hypothetical protein